MLLAASLAGLPAPAQLPIDDGRVGLGLALRRLPVAGRVLYVTAHPDDEPNGVLAELAVGRGLRVGLLTLTRGEGGQNALGPELFEALGLLRTEELQAAHRLDGAEQLFARAFEFGFSFSVDETLGRWGREATLGDLVRSVRAFRPDVIFTLPLEARGEHSHHLATARLAREAFRAAADPARFPEQLQAGLRPWQASRLYQGGTGGGAAELGPSPARLATGRHDPLLGRSSQQLGSLARAAHRSQSASQLEADPGPAEALFALVDAEPAVSGPPADPFDGLDLSLRGLLRFVPAAAREPIARGLEAAQAEVDEAQAAFDCGSDARLGAALRRGLVRLGELRAAVTATEWPAAARLELAERLAFQQGLFEEALRRAHALSLRVTPSDDLVAPGQSFTVRVEAWNAGAEPLQAEELELLVPPGWSATRREGGPGELPAGGVLRATFDVRVAEPARVSQPYWRRAPGGDRLELDVPADEGRPWSPPPVEARLLWRSGQARASLRAPALVRAERPAGGERRNDLAVVPALDVSVAPELLVFPPGAREREARVRVVNQRPGAGEAVLRLTAPRGWRVEPAETRLSFTAEGEERLVVARVTPAAVPSDQAELLAVASLDGHEHSEGAQVISYDHVQPRRLYRPARVRLVAVDARVGQGISVAYVRGVGDQVPEALRQLGLPVAELKGEELAATDLERFSTIVLGVRAYTDAATRAQQARLMRFVEGGGHLVVQLSRNEFNVAGAASRSVMGPGTRDGAGDSPFAPYPASVTTRRVTDENAPLTTLAAGHPLLTAPNPLGPADWQGWVQERALQLLEVRDPRYVEVLSTEDTFPENPGEKRGLLVEARVGRGTWTYVGLGLFRQLPAGVPGAYRLLANLVSRPRGK